MSLRIGIRREDKNEWEGRVPLTPHDVEEIVRKEGIDVVLQPSTIRIFPDDDYKHAGAGISEDLSPCQVIMAVKEIPVDFFQGGKTYIFFSHTIKGQEYNMPMLKRMMELGCQLIDYELVTDDEGRRLIFFGRHAGLAGMIDSLWALGKRLKWEGIPNPFDEIEMAHNYPTLEDAKKHIADVGEKIKKVGIPPVLTPFICGITGYGNVSQGAQEIIDLLPVEEIYPAELQKPSPSLSGHSEKLLKVVFKEDDIVEPIYPDATFELQDYYNNPNKYRSRFEKYLPHLTMLVNCIYWDKRYPRLVTLDWLKRAYSSGKKPPLRIIGDISCDIEGSIQCTVKTTDPGNPLYIYHPLTGKVTDGWEGFGPVIMAVDNLPSELSAESSSFFGEVLIPFIPELVKANYSLPFEDLKLLSPLKRAVILHQGKLTPDYEHLKKYITK